MIIVQLSKPIVGLAVGTKKIFFVQTINNQGHNWLPTEQAEPSCIMVEKQSIKISLGFGQTNFFYQYSIWV